MTEEIHIEKRIHPVWDDYIKAAKIDPVLQLGHVVEKYHYILSSTKGKISIVELPDYFRDTVTLWEIFCQGELFDDVDRFYSYKEAEAKARQYIG